MGDTKLMKGNEHLLRLPSGQGAMLISVTITPQSGVMEYLTTAASRDKDGTCS
jgi:hypothetical protein